MNVLSSGFGVGEDLRIALKAFSKYRLIGR